MHHHINVARRWYDPKYFGRDPITPPVHHLTSQWKSHLRNNGTRVT